MNPYTSKIEERIVFILVFVGVLVLTYGLFFAIDFLPEAPKKTETQNTTDSTVIETPPMVSDRIEIPEATSEETSVESPTSVRVTEPEEEEVAKEVVREESAIPVASSGEDAYPVRIVFDTLDGRSVPVLNPDSRSIEVLDEALLRGVVRHPDSADFEQVGTVLLFGHSSYLPNVLNKNFQAFNGIQNMKWGDTIRLYSKSKEYTYRVDRVYEASALDAEVKIEEGKAKLALVTCDSFGSKSDRFVVEATLIQEGVL